MPTSAKITLNGFTHHFTINDGQTVLETLIEENVKPPFSCKNGICGTCKARLTSGEVSMAKHPALDDTDVARGMILCCQSVPKSSEIVIVYE